MTDKDGNSGFSLIELMVVAAIAVILVATVVLSIPGLQQMRNVMALETLAAHLRYARNIALTRELTTRISFSVASNSYTLYVSDTNAPGEFVVLPDPVTQQDCIVNVGERFPQTAILAVDIDSGSVLYFNATNAVPCNSSGAPIVSIGTISFVSGGNVTIMPGTGYMSVSR